MARLAGLLAQVEPAGAVLVGMAGVGKSRVLAEFVNYATTQGVRSRVIHATQSAAAVPLGCLAEVLAPRLPAGRGLASVPLFHEAVAALVAEATAGGRWLLAVDDLPYLDDASAAALHQCLVATGAPFVGTARQHEARPEALDALWREGRIELHMVVPLGEATVVELAERAVGGTLNAASFRLIVELAEGNPLALRELLASAKDLGLLRQVGEQWDLADGYQAGQQVQALVAHRLANTEPDARRVLELVALAEPIALEALSALADVDLIDALIDRSLLVVQLAGAQVLVHSGHPLHGDVLRSQLPPGRRRRLAAALEPLLPADPSAGPAFLRRAMLHLEAGSPSDAGLLSRAALAARNAGDHSLAIRFADAALAVPNLSGASASRAHLAGATAHVATGDATAPVSFERAFSAAPGDEEMVDWAAAEALAACDAHGLAAEGLAWAADLAPDSSTAAAWRERAADRLGESLLRSPIIVALLAAQPAAMDGPALLDGGPIPIGIARAAKGWRVRFQGTELVLGDRVGFAYLAALVTSPGREVRADVLAAGGGQPAAQSRQVVLDRTGRATLEGEAHRVVEALRRARRSGPARHVEELEQQAEALAAELARHGSFRGADRAFVDDNERARTAVRKAILRAVTDIEAVHPAAAQYLRSHLSTGSSCIFRP